MAVQEKVCVMKVVSKLDWLFTVGTFSKYFKYHDRGSSYCDPADREGTRFVCESTAYQRMKAKGLCKRGVVPDFMGQSQKYSQLFCQV